MAAETPLDRLQRHNPFVSASAGDPWDRQYPHVPAINEQAFQGVCRLIRQKVQEPALNCAGLILGEVGSGKTHLLGRILTYTTQVQPLSPLPIFNLWKMPNKPTAICCGK